jgi:hypothetical protein
MTMMDKVIGAMNPIETDEVRAAAHAQARASAGRGWLALVLDHHEQIDQAFDAVFTARSATGRRAAQKELAVILTGHSIAEESVLYPALAKAGDKSAAKDAYQEQSEAKTQMSMLEDLEPMSDAYLAKLEEIRTAVQHHVFEEESTWFPELRRQADSALQAKLTRRYKEEFERYVGVEA